MQVPQPLLANSHNLFILLNISKAGENNRRIHFTFTLDLVLLFCDDICYHAVRSLSSTEIHRIIYKSKSLHVEYILNFTTRGPR